MSSTYSAICLDHTPPLVIDEAHKGFDDAGTPIRPDGHEGCRVAIGRYSYPLIEIWLPTPYADREGRHAGRWYDVSWMRAFPTVAAAICEEKL